MRIIIVDSDVAFVNSLEQRYKKLGMYCQAFSSAAQAFAEIKKNPDTIDLVLATRELANNQDGLVLIQNMRKDAKTNDVPFIVMSSAWGKSDFAKHQKSEFGANAYFSKKSPLAELDATIEAVTGFRFQAAAEKEKTRLTKSITGLSSPSLSGVQLQPANDVVNIAEEVPDNISMEQPIQLFAGLEEPPVAPEAPKAEVPKAAEPPKQAVPTVNSVPVAPHQPLTGNAAIAVSGPLASSEVPNPPKAIEVSLVNMTNQEPKVEHQGKPNVQEEKPAAKSIEVSISEVAPVQSEGVSVSSGGEPEVFERTSENKIPPSPFKATQVEAPSLLALEMDPSQAQNAANPAAKAPESSGISLEGQSPTPTSEKVPVAEVSKEVTNNTQAPVSEEEAAKDLPYLFTGPASAGGSVTKSMMVPIPANMAPNVSASADLGLPPTVVSDDVETLKRYLSMREQDVAVLTTQLTYAKEELLKYEDTVKRLTLQTEDFFHQVNDLKKQVSEQAHELQHAGKSMEGEVEQLRLEVKAKIDRIKFLDERLEDSSAQYEKLKERVRLDIRKIRVREKELESKLEILKKDSETLIGARENKILELKRKIDLLEFNYDTLQDKNEQEKKNVQAREEKVEKIYKILKLAMGVVETEEGAPSQTTKLKVAS